METKRIIQLLTLSAQLYTIARDKEFFESISKLIKGGKKPADSPEGDKVGEEGEESEHQLLDQLIQKANEARDEIEKKMEEIAVSVYGKMHIAHTDEIKKLEEKIAELEKELKKDLQMAENRIYHLEGDKKQE